MYILWDSKAIGLEWNTRRKTPATAATRCVRQSDDEYVSSGPGIYSNVHFTQSFALVVGDFGVEILYAFLGLWEHLHANQAPHSVVDQPAASSAEVAA